jgi:hypothetical protein
MRNSLAPVTKFHNSDPGVGVARGATKCHALTALKPKCDARPQAMLSLVADSRLTSIGGDLYLSR